ncbi:MAG: hypothetical protein U0903_12445 [Planctomycetales bacterium]
MGLQCGPVGRTSKVDWEYLGTTDAGDRYRFTRVFPVEGPMTTTTKEIVYAGKELMVFQDEYQRVVIRPQPEPKKEEKKQKGCCKVVRLSPSDENC